MNRAVLILMTGLLLIGGVAEVSAHDGNGTHDHDDEGFDYMPVLYLAIIAAVVVLIAKYGP